MPRFFTIASGVARFRRGESGRVVRAWVTALAAMIAFGMCSLVSAQTNVDSVLASAEARYNDGYFSEALQEYQRVARMARLTRAQLHSSLVGQALAHYAQGDAAAVTQAVSRAVLVDPAFRIPRSFPPAIQREFEATAVRAHAPTVTCTASGVEGGAQVRGAALGEVYGLEVHLRLQFRWSGETSFQSADAVSATLVGGGSAVECVASLIGPGGVVLATDGTNVSPHNLPVVVPEPGGEVRPPSGSDDTIWIVLGISGGVLLVGAAVITAVVIANQPPDTQLGPPTLSGLSAPLVSF